MKNGSYKDDMIKRVFLFFFLSALFACKDKVAIVHLEENAENIPIETGTDVIIQYSDSGVPKFIMKAPLLERYDKPVNYSEMRNGIFVEFFNTEGKANSTLNAKYGISYDDEGKMEAKNNVVLVNDRGEKLETEHLIWEEKTSKIHTKANVKITTQDEILYGEGLESNRDFTKYKILKIKGTKLRTD